MLDFIAKTVGIVNLLLIWLGKLCLFKCEKSFFNVIVSINGAPIVAFGAFCAVFARHIANCTFITCFWFDFIQIGLKYSQTVYDLRYSKNTCIFVIDSVTFAWMSAAVSGNKQREQQITWRSRQHKQRPFVSFVSATEALAIAIMAAKSFILKTIFF